MAENDSVTRLFQAAQAGDAPALEELLQAEPELANRENEDGLTPLGFAAHFGSPAAVRVLLEHGADVEALSHSRVPYIPSNTALHAAIAGERSVEVIRLLLDRGADPNRTDSDGHTCLHAAAFHDDGTEILQLLIGRGAELNARGGAGETALSLAIRQGNRTTAERLRQLGAEE
ncbi:ankyrin repeat domain-containing protein [Gorillibacterium sp. sgz500922]|uniref:ankyrin repeat domain-containing protein n=1 Tax=Gorillibacterium sp. sgz500922 TaxID=3446694 RepID=UPI003F66E03E